MATLIAASIDLTILKIIAIFMIVMGPFFASLRDWMFAILFMSVSDIIKISSLILVP